MKHFVKPERHLTGGKQLYKVTRGVPVSDKDGSTRHRDEIVQGGLVRQDAIKLKNKLNADMACDVCGSMDVVEVIHMGKNCNTCHPL
jgi:hypothetical protein